jgi:hypothetical protein
LASSDSIEPLVSSSIVRVRPVVTQSIMACAVLRIMMSPTDFSTMAPTFMATPFSPPALAAPLKANRSVCLAIQALAFSARPQTLMKAVPKMARSRPMTPPLGETQKRNFCISWPFVSIRSASRTLRSMPKFSRISLTESAAFFWNSM